MAPSLGLVEDTTGGILPGVTVEADSPVNIEGTITAFTDGAGLIWPVGRWTQRIENGRQTLHDHQPAAGHVHRHLHAARFQHVHP